MKISVEIETKLLKDLDINIQQLVFINLLYQKTTLSKLKEFVKHVKFDKDFQDLIDKKIISSDSDLIEIEEVKFENEFLENYKAKFKYEFFEEFHSLYPVYSIRPDGLKQFIRNNPRICSALYKKIVGNDEDKHKHLMKCLLKEIDDREMKGTMKYMLTMNNWLTKEGWTYGEELEKDNENVTIVGYGEHFM